MSITDAELRRVRSAIEASLHERREEDGGTFLQALAVIELVRRSTSAGQLEKARVLFEAMCRELGIAVYAVPFSALELAQVNDEPQRDELEHAIESVRRAMTDAKSDPNVTIPVLVEFLAGVVDAAPFPNEAARWMWLRFGGKQGVRKELARA